MSLLFDDENIVKCTECSGLLFEENITFGLNLKKDKTNQEYFTTIQPKYIVKCSNCGEIISVSEKSLIRNEGE